MYQVSKPVTSVSVNKTLEQNSRQLASVTIALQLHNCLIGPLYLRHFGTAIVIQEDQQFKTDYKTNVTNV